MAKRVDSKAQQYMTKRQYGQAITTWNHLLSLQPDSPQIYPKLARAYELCGQYPQALQTLQKYFSLYPASQDILHQIIKIQLRLFDAAGAASNWEKLKEITVAPDSLILHGDILAIQKQYIQASEEYKKALTMDPKNQTALARLAITLQGLHKPAEAAVYYQRLDSLVPESPDILLQKGNYWLLTGNLEKAELFLRKAIKEAPDNQDLKIRLAELYLDNNQISRAAAIFQQLLDQNPLNRFYKKMLIESLLQDGQFERADSLLARLTAAESQDIDFLLLKGKYYLNTGAYLVAASQFELAREKEPRLPLTHYFLALTYFACGQNNLGEESLIKALTLNPSFTNAELLLANYYYKAGDYNLAMEHVTRIRKKEPENPRPYLIRGNILLAAKNIPSAIEAFQQACILDQDLAAPIYYTGISASLTGKPGQALQTYRNILSRQPLLADATLLYTELLQEQGNLDNALQYLENTIADYPDSPYLHHIKGLVLLSAGKKQEAEAAFTTTLRQAPDVKESYLQLFRLAGHAPDKLYKLLIKATDNIRDFTEAQIRLASWYIANNEPQKAITLLKEALSRNPNAPLLANNLAWLYLEHQPDNIDETLRLATIAYDKLPNNAAIADTLGWVYYKKNLPIRAGWLLEEAAALEPTNPEILYHLAIVQLEQGNRTAARENFIKAGIGAKSPRLKEQIKQQLRTVP